jgi:SP family arabinose:H+ symporter-like MFS transporter
MTSDRGHYPGAAKRGYAFCIAFVASLGGFLFGYDLVIISGAQIFLRDQFALTPQQFGFATSSAILGCIAGPAGGALLCDRFGRKFTLIMAAALFALSAVGTALAHDILTFNAFRIIGGVGVGLASLASPMYIAEIAPARSRGRLGLMYQLAITIGAVAATIVSYHLAKFTAPTVSWRFMFASVLVPVIAFSVLLVRVPASPRWLAEKGRFSEALSVLTKIGGEATARKELTEIRATMRDEVGNVRELFQPGMRAALFTGIILALLNNWTGWTGIAFYLPTLFQQAGFSNASDAIAQNVLVMGGNVFLTLLSIWLVDRVGRRPLWILCSAAMCVFLFLAGLVFELHTTGSFVVLVIFLCAAPHAIGLGPLPWLMMSEIYPTRIRARAVSLSTTLLWVAAFTGPFAFPTLEAASEKMVHSIAGVFWLYAGICLFSLAWGWKFLPETRGRTLENIADSWKGARSKAAPSVG